MTLLIIAALGMSQQTLAFTSDNLKCFGDHDSTLTIQHFYDSALLEPQTSKVKAQLTSPDITANFAGQHVKGLGYNLKDTNGLPVELQVTTVPSYGGRCGRCNPAEFPNTYAKLTLNNGQEYNFTCE